MIIVQDSMRNGKSYDGNTKKFGIIYNGIDYIVKYKKRDDMSVYCEYICSNFIKSLGISCHDVYLGNYNGELVNVMRDFTSGTCYTLHSFKETNQSSEDTDLGSKEYTYNDVLYMIDKHTKMIDSDKLTAKIGFWNMFICDAIIGNRDRHWGNWGYLSDGYKYKFSPLYDNGAGLFPDVNKVINTYIDESTRMNFMKDRVFTFPASLFKIKKEDRAYRTNYYEMFSDLRINKQFASQVKKIRGNISYVDVFNIISKIVIPIDGLNSWYKRFYIEIITLRYMCIVLRMDFNKSYKLLEEKLK